MGFSFGSPSSSSHNQTDILNDNRQQDNKVAADGGSSVKSTAGGNLTDQTGALIGGGGATTFNISSSDKGSFDLASTIANRAFDTVAANNGASNALAGNALSTTAKLAQGSPIGTDWKGLVLPIAAIVAVLGFLFLNRKGHH